MLSAFCSLARGAPGADAVSGGPPGLSGEPGGGNPGAAGPDRGRPQQSEPVALAQAREPDDEASGATLAQLGGAIVVPPRPASPGSSLDSDRVSVPDVTEAARTGPRTSWAMAPLSYRWGGNVGFEALYNYGGTANQTQLQPTLGLNGSAASYIWQPWFAQVSGNIGMNYSSVSAQSSDFTSNSFYGSGRLNVVPFSRFPFEAYAEVTDTRNDGVLFSDQFRNTRTGLKQGYRTPTGDGSYLGSFDRTIFDSGSGSSSTFDQLQLQGQQTAILFEDVHRFFGNAYFSRAQQSLLAADVSNYGISANHSFQPAENLSIYDDLNYTQADFLDQTNRSYLLSSTANWRSLERPLTVVGGARLFGLRFGGIGGQSQQDSLTLNGSATYAPTYNWSFGGGAGVEFNKDGPLTTAQFLGANYQADPRPVRSLTLNWGSGLTLTNVTGDNPSTALTGSANYSLSGTTPGVVGGILGYAFSQSLSGGVSAGDNAFVNNQLTTVGSGSWTRAVGPDVRTLTLTATDFRNLDSSSAAENINLQGTYSRFLSNTSSLAGNFSIQWNQISGALGGSTSAILMTGQVVYQNSAFLGVPRLLLQSSLSATAISVGSGQTATLTIDNPVNYTWDNTLYYQIGRLRVEGRAQFAQYQGSNQGIAWIRLNRDFGN